MDSCNSTGSMESSSGGDDDDYPSRPQASAAAPTLSIFPFLMNSSNGLLPFLHDQDHNPPLPVFEALPNYFDQIARPGLTDRHNHQHHHQSQLSQLGAAVSGDELGVMLPPPALQVPANLGYRPSQSKTADGLTGGMPNLAIPPVSDPPKLLEEHLEMRNNNGAPPARRKPKKRTRASRRAPTTILTTDTSNFRAMVQEFTGIPSPPFATKTSPFPRTRFDLFGTNIASSATALGSSQLHFPSHHRRPFAQRLFQAAPLQTTLFVPATTSSNNTAISTSTELFFPLLSDNYNNIDSTPTATTPSSLLDFGQILTKYSSGHNHKRAEQEQHQRPGGNLEPRGINKNVPVEFGLSRLDGHDGDRDDGFVVSSSSSQNIAIVNSSEGMPVESWICSSD